MAWKGWSLTLGFVLVLCVNVRAARADEYKRSIQVQSGDVGTITFSRLVVRLSSNEIAVEGDQLRIQFIETLRKLGYAARGAESLVFDRDDSNNARFVLGGTVSELQCRPPDRYDWRRCWLGVSWEVLDRENDRVVYRAHTRHAHEGYDPKRLANELTWGTFYSLLSRQKFVAAISTPSTRPSAKPSYSQAKFLRCGRADAPMPGSAEQLMQATVVVRAGEKMGSGTLVSPDGFVLTAAHVVDGQSPISFQPRGGPKISAGVIRIDSHTDVALLKAGSGSDYPCVPIRSEPVTAGEDLFAIGSPVAQELAFTLTRGVVSGVRKIDDVSLVQTDASVNRGNSGGPLLDAKGKLVGVVSWKIVESGVEGIAFGVSTQSALTGLAIEPSDQSDAELSRPSVAPKAKPPTGVDDSPDQVPTLWPAAPAVPAEPRRLKTPKAKLYGTIGLIAVGVGAVGVGVTYGLYGSKKDTMKQDEFDNLRLANDISWVAVLGGATLFAVSEFLPRVEVPAKTTSGKRRNRSTHGRLFLGLGPGMAMLQGTY